MTSPIGRILALALVAHAAYTTPLWANLSAAWAARGAYRETRTARAFNGFAFDDVARAIDAALPPDVPVALGDGLSGSDFLRQRITEVIYPRPLAPGAPHVIEAIRANAFDPSMGPLLLALPADQAVLVLTGGSGGGSARPAPVLDASTLAAAGALAAALGFGWIVGRVSGLAGHPLPGGLLAGPARLLAGAWLLAVAATAATMAQVRLPLATVVVLGVAVAAGAGLAALWRRRSVARDLGTIVRQPEQWLLGGLVLAVVASVLVHPVTLWDGRSIWLFHAKRFFLHGMMPLADLQAGDLAWSHPEYPPLWPAWLALWSGLAGTWNERAASLGAPLLLGGVLLLFWSLARARLGRIAGSAVAFAALAGVAYLSTGAYGDGVLMLLLGVEFLALASPGREPLGWLAAAAAALTKFEGLVFAAIVAVACEAVARSGRGRPPAVRLAPFAALLPGLAWLAWSRAVGLEGVFHDIRWGEVGADLGGRLAIVARGALTAASTTTYIRCQGWLVEGAAGAIAGVACGAVLPSRGGWSALAVTAALVLTIFGILVVTPLDLQWHVGTSIDRLLIHPALFAVMAPGLFLHEAATSGTASTEDDRAVRTRA